MQLGEALERISYATVPKGSRLVQYGEEGQPRIAFLDTPTDWLFAEAKLFHLHIQQVFNENILHEELQKEDVEILVEVLHSLNDEHKTSEMGMDAIKAAMDRMFTRLQKCLEIAKAQDFSRFNSPYRR